MEHKGKHLRVQEQDSHGRGNQGASKLFDEEVWRKAEDTSNGVQITKERHKSICQRLVDLDDNEDMKKTWQDYQLMCRLKVVPEELVRDGEKNLRCLQMMWK